MGTYTTLPNLGLRIPDGFGNDLLGSIDYFNWERLSNNLLTLATMLDVDTSGLANGDVLAYNSGSTNWEVLTPTKAPNTTTTTTTTTT